MKYSRVEKTELIMKKIKVGISSCLLGKNVRYDGGSKLDRYLNETFGRYIEWVPVCPEVEYGLPVPRETMRLTGRPDGYCLVTTKTGVDHTEGMLAWAANRLEELDHLGLAGFVFKGKSPGCGLRRVKVFGPRGAPSRSGIGIFAGAFIEKYPLTPVEDDESLHDPALRENFIERLFVFHRWSVLTQKETSIEELAEFHRDHELLVLSHSSKHCALLRNLTANQYNVPIKDLQTLYASKLMEGLDRPATLRNNAMVLKRIAQFFRKRLTSGEKQELNDLIGRYRSGTIPLVVPILLLQHYARKFNEPYLERQCYLNPHPLELLLRNNGQDKRQ